MCSIQILGSSSLAKQGVTLGARVHVNFPLRGGGGSKSVKVSGLDPSVSEADVKREFSAQGPIDTVHLLRSKAMGGLNHCFVNFYSQEDAKRAVAQMDGKVCLQVLKRCLVYAFLSQN